MSRRMMRRQQRAGRPERARYAPPPDAAAAAAAAGTLSTPETGHLPADGFSAGLKKHTLMDFVGSKRVRSRVTNRMPIVKAGEGHGTQVVPGSTVRFPLNSTFDTDVPTLVLRFGDATATGGTNTCFPNGIHGIIDRIDLVVNGSPQTSYPRFNIAGDVKYYSDLDPTATGNEIMGFATEADRIALASVATTYELPIGWLLKGIEILPTSSVYQNQTFEFHVHFAEAASCLEDTAGTSTYTILRPELVYDGVTVDDETRGVMRQAAMSGDALHFESWAVASHEIAAGSATVDVPVPISNTSVSRMVGIMRPTATLNTTTQHDRLHDWKLDNLTSFQALVNGTPFPNFKIRTGATEIREAYRHYLRGWGDQHTEFPSHYHGGISFDEFSNTAASGIGKFIALVDFRKDHQPGIMSGIDTTRAGGRVALQLSSTAGFAASQSVNVFVYYDCKLVLAPGSTGVMVVQ